MIEYDFDSCGTRWHLKVDAQSVPLHLFELLRQQTDDFDQRLSRFIPTSAANALRYVGPGTYPIDSDLATILLAGKQVSDLTKGGFDMSIATLFEKLGYDREYRLSSAPDSVTWQAPEWSVTPDAITTNGPIVFDVGGIGKGYWIDVLSNKLTEYGYPHHVVDGGGDLRATQKQSGDGWCIALEWPGKPEIAIGQVLLKDQGLAASDTFRRRWKHWNHLIHAKTLMPVSQLRGCFGIAPSAFLADQITSAIAFLPESDYELVAHGLDGTYCVMRDDETLCIDSNWPGEFFI